MTPAELAALAKQVDEALDLDITCETAERRAECNLNCPQLYAARLAFRKLLAEWRPEDDPTGDVHLYETRDAILSALPKLEEP